MLPQTDIYLRRSRSACTQFPDSDLHPSIPHPPNALLSGWGCRSVRRLRESLYLFEQEQRQPKMGACDSSGSIDHLRSV